MVSYRKGAILLMKCILGYRKSTSTGFWIWLFLCLSACNTTETEKKKLLRANRITDPITRHEGEVQYLLVPFEYADRPSYPWEKKYVGAFPKITKEFFHCMGSDLNPEKISIDGNKEVVLRDCMGTVQHGLPLREQKEYIYPILMDLLNYVQEKMGKRVVITTGFRCPVHNAYADPSPAAKCSKHQIGAEVDFYVEGKTEQPLEAVKWVMDYYSKEGPALSVFKVCQKNPEGLVHLGWFNKEITVRIHEKQEGRDFDNRHPYPYVTIEVRYDREKDLPVVYEWKRAQHGYLRRH